MAPPSHSHARWLARSTTAPCERRRAGRRVGTASWRSAAARRTTRPSSGSARAGADGERRPRDDDERPPDGRDRPSPRRRPPARPIECRRPRSARPSSQLTVRGRMHGSERRSRASSGRRAGRGRLVADGGDRAARLHGVAWRRRSTPRARSRATAASRSSTLITRPQNAAGPAGRPARSTTSTISPPPPTRWKPWRISPTSRTRLQRRAGGVGDRARTCARASRWSRRRGRARWRRAGARRARRRPASTTSVGKPSIVVDVGGDARQRPADEAGRPRRIDAHAGAEQRDQPVDRRSGRGARHGSTGPPTTSHSTRAITSAPRGSRPSCQARNVRTSASSSACLADRLADAVAGPALLEQQDRPLVLARRRRLQQRRHLAGVQRIDPGVALGRREQRRRVARARRRRGGTASRRAARRTPRRRRGRRTRRSTAGR